MSAAGESVGRTGGHTPRSGLELVSVPGLPLVGAGDPLEGWIVEALRACPGGIAQGDVVVVASKVVSRAQGRFVDLSAVAPSDRALELAREVEKDPALVEVILRESTMVSRARPGVLIVRHGPGFVSANAAIDASNARPRGAPEGSGPWVTLLPEDPDGWARGLRATVKEELGVDVGVIVTDSFGRPFRVGTVGVAIGVAGLPAVLDQRGSADLHGRVLEHTITALADQIAAAADLVAGQAAEGSPLTRVRGLAGLIEGREGGADGVGTLLRAPDGDLYLRDTARERAESDR